MSINEECALAVQSSTPQTHHQITQAYAGYFVIGLTALVLAFVIWIFIRTIARRSSKQ